MEPLPKPGPKTVAGFEELAGVFASRGARKGSMFGMPVLKAKDKVFAGTFGDAMTFKLGPEDLAKALKMKGVERFEPMPGRAMKEWALVPVARSKLWAQLAEQSWTYLAG